MSRDFKTRYGPTALVTGAANGIGRAFAFGLARRGLSLLLVDFDAEGLDATVKGVREESDVSVETCVADLSDSAELDRVCEVARSAEIGLLVNKAGIGKSAAFLEIPLEEQLKGLDVNVGAALVLTHRLAPAMCERGRGGLIFTSSMSALVGPPGVAQYASTKAYLRHLAEALYGEFYVIGSIVGGVFTAPFMSTTQGVVPLRMRAFAAAISTLLSTLIGLAGGPLVVGALADALAPEYGADALRYALLFPTLIPMISGVICLGGAGLVASDLARSRALDTEAPA